MAETHLADQDDPAIDIFLIAKSDSVNDANGPYRGFAMGGAGILKITTMNGQDITIPSGVFGVGIIHPLRIKRLWTAVTTATDVYGVK